MHFNIILHSTIFVISIMHCIIHIQFAILLGTYLMHAISYLIEVGFDD